MNLITLIKNLIERVRSRLIPYKDIAAAEQIKTPLAPEMVRALSLWCELYHDRAPWKEPGKVKSLNLCAMAASEIARQVVLEMKATIDAGGEDAEGKPTVNERSEYLKGEFDGLLAVLRLKLELGCAAGGMIVKPCPDPATGKIYFDFAPDWSLYPLAFDGAGSLSDVIIPDVFRDGDAIYTRLERHTLDGENVVITQRAFRSTHEDTLGSEVPLVSVPRWASLEPEVTITGAGGMLFGWYRVAAANTVDADCALGASVYAKAVEVAREIDLQYSRLLWEFEGGELAVDVDPTALYEKSDGKGHALPKLNERLFRAVDTGADATYEVFAPALRDVSLVNGLNQLLIRFEDLCGLSRGTFSDADCVDRLLVNLAHHFKYLQPGEEPGGATSFAQALIVAAAPAPPQTGCLRSASQWQARKLAELGQVNRENVEIIRRMLGDVPAELADGLEQAILDALADIEEPLKQAAEEGLLGGGALSPAPDPRAMRAFTLYHGQSLDGMNLVNSTMLESTAEAYREMVADITNRLLNARGIVNAATGEVLAGVESFNQALALATRRLLDVGLTGFVDGGGRQWQPDTYVAMTMRTTYHNVSRAAFWERNEEYGNDLYLVSQHPGARPLCYPWQCKVISRTDEARDVTDGAGQPVHV